MKPPRIHPRLKRCALICAVAIALAAPWTVGAIARHRWPYAGHWESKKPGESPMTIIIDRSGHFHYHVDTDCLPNPDVEAVIEPTPSGFLVRDPHYTGLLEEPPQFSLSKDGRHLICTEVRPTVYFNGIKYIAGETTISSYSRVPFWRSMNIRL